MGLNKLLTTLLALDSLSIYRALLRPVCTGFFLSKRSPLNWLFVPYTTAESCYIMLFRADAVDWL